MIWSDVRAIKVCITELTARIVKLETESAVDNAALEQFRGHVQNCERDNRDAAKERAAFRKEMRGYAAMVTLISASALGFLLYHGLPYQMVHVP
jgi:hypothetical protein